MTHRKNAADLVSAAGKIMSDNNQPSVWQRHRIAIILGVVAVLLYLGSIVWMVYGRGQVA